MFLRLCDEHAASIEIIGAEYADVGIRTFRMFRNDLKSIGASNPVEMGHNDEAIRRHGFSLTWMNFIQDMHRKFNLFIVISNNISIYNKNHKVIHNITNNSLIHIKQIGRASCRERVCQYV